MYSTSDFRNGLKILIGGMPFEITYFQHVKPGKGGAFVRTKLKNLKNNTTIDKTFRAGEKVGKPDLEEIDMQFLYQDGNFHFMNLQTYEQSSVTGETVGDAANYLVENTICRVLIFNGEILCLELPSFVVLEVSECEPGIKGDTVSGAVKFAKLESGVKIQVPLFINKGEKIKVDTRTGEYVERVQ